MTVLSPRDSIKTAFQCFITNNLLYLADAINRKSIISNQSIWNGWFYEAFAGGVSNEHKIVRWCSSLSRLSARLLPRYTELISMKFGSGLSFHVDESFSVSIQYHSCFTRS
jgi:hypothetical protein